jgi:hypothetical protein
MGRYAVVHLDRNDHAPFRPPNYQPRNRPDVQNLRLAMVPPFGKAGHLIEPVREIEQLFSGFPDRCLPR